MNLDNEQENAAKYIKGHSLIIAGAGCGKTTTLLKKIDYLLKNNVNEKDILVITFTNETVNEFRKKCLNNINVYTFHKVSLNYINKESLDIVMENLLDKIIEDVLNNLNEKFKKKIYYIFRDDLRFYSKNNYSKIINSNHYYSPRQYFKSIVNIINAEKINIEKISINKIHKNETIILYIVSIIINIYSKEKLNNNMIDFDDMIKIATDNLNNNVCRCNYKYILVDEFQDISRIRLEFLKSLINSSHSVLTAVGDDFQSIYGFSGSNIELLYNFENYFENSKIFYITKTYRCPQKIVNIAGKFVMKNKYQLKKNLISNNHNNGKIHKIYCTNKSSVLKKIINKFKETKKSILILSRNNYDINEYTNNTFFIKDSFIVYKEQLYKNIRFLTMHKSKGLEADIVIIINLSNSINGFPSSKKINLIDKICPSQEKIEYAEERRLFYVALTRCKEEVYLLIDQNNPSKFIKEV